MTDSETPDLQELPAEAPAAAAPVPPPSRPRPAPAPVPRAAKRTAAAKQAPETVEMASEELAAATQAPEASAAEGSAAEVPPAEVSASVADKLQELEERLATEPAVEADPVPTGSPAANDAPETAAVEVSAAEVSATEVSASIANKLQELEERLAVEPPAVEAPPAKPAKKAPAKKATKAPATKAAATKAAATKAPATKAPAKAPAAKKAPAKKAAPPTMEIAIPPAPPTPVEAAAPVKATAPPRATRPPKLQPAVHAEPVVPPPALTEAPPRPVPGTTTPGSGRGMKAALALIVLLLAAAAGLGAAAIVQARPSTWESRAIVQLTGGVAAADPVTDRVQGVGKYRLTVANSSFTALSAFKAGVQDDQVRERIVGLSRGPGQILLVVRADTADHTDALVAAAARNLVEAVTSDQALRVAAADARLTASTPGRIGDAEQVKPTDEDATVAGALAAGAVLVLGLAIVFLRRGKDSKK